MGTFHDQWFGTLELRHEGRWLGARLGDLALEVRAHGEGGLEFASLGSVDATARAVIEGGEVVAHELELAGESVRFAR